MTNTDDVTYNTENIPSSNSCSAEATIIVLCLLYTNLGLYSGNLSHCPVASILGLLKSMVSVVIFAVPSLITSPIGNIIDWVSGFSLNFQCHKFHLNPVLSIKFQLLLPTSRSEYLVNLQTVATVLFFLDLIPEVHFPTQQFYLNNHL